MVPTRRSQPYRQGAREPGMALSAMLMGKPAFLPNPADQIRQRQQGARRQAPPGLAELIQALLERRRAQAPFS